MAIIRNRWSPDTHPDTWIEYEWDDSSPPESRAHTPVAARLRGLNQAPGQVAAAFDKVLAENQRKNFGIQAAIDAAAPGLALTADDFAFSVVEDGAVTLTVKKALTVQQRNAMRQALAAKFGTAIVLNSA